MALGRLLRLLAAAGALPAAVLSCVQYEASAGERSPRGDSLERARQDSINRAQPGYVVDSIFPVDEEIRRFNEGLARPVALSGGASSRAELVRQFLIALERRDTTRLRDMLVTRAEFGALIFPESPFARAPYKTKPIVVWTQLLSDSERGLQRLIDRAAGPAARVSDMRCDSDVIRQGHNRFWRECTFLLQRADAPARRLRLFGQIVERAGHAKFVSYGNGF